MPGAEAGRDPVSPDRYGERDGLDDAAHRAHCTGWRGEDAEGRPRPCLRCKPHLATRARPNDFAETIPSDRARAAYERAEREDRHR